MTGDPSDLDRIERSGCAWDVHAVATLRKACRERDRLKAQVIDVLGMCDEASEAGATSISIELLTKALTNVTPNAASPDAGDTGAATLGSEVVCYGHCGSLTWTIREFGRVTHKQACPHRAESWCQSHPKGCPVGCQPVMWAEWAAHS